MFQGHGPNITQKTQTVAGKQEHMHNADPVLILYNLPEHMKHQSIYTKTNPGKASLSGVAKNVQEIAFALGN